MNRREVADLIIACACVFPGPIVVAVLGPWGLLVPILIGLVAIADLFGLTGRKL